MLSTCLVEFEDPTADPVAVLIATSFLKAIDVPLPDPIDERNKPLMKDTDDDPIPADEPCLITNRNGSPSPEEVAKPVADLNIISRSVDVDSPAEPDPDAERTRPRINVDDCRLDPLDVAVL